MKRLHCLSYYNVRGSGWTLCITVTSNWARWRLKSPASRLFTQPFIQAQIKENIKALRHWPLCGEIHRWQVNSPHKWPVTRKMFPSDAVIMDRHYDVINYVHFSLYLTLMIANMTNVFISHGQSEARIGTEHEMNIPTNKRIKVVEGA